MVLSVTKICQRSSFALNFFIAFKVLNKNLNIIKFTPSTCEGFYLPSSAEMRATKAVIVLA